MQCCFFFLFFFWALVAFGSSRHRGDRYATTTSVCKSRPGAPVRHVVSRIMPPCEGRSDGVCVYLWSVVWVWRERSRRSKGQKGKRKRCAYQDSDICMRYVCASAQTGVSNANAEKQHAEVTTSVGVEPSGLDFSHTIAIPFFSVSTQPSTCSRLGPSGT